MVARGLSEARTSVLVGRQTLGSGFVGETVELHNPLSEDHVALRPSLIPGLIAALERNMRAGAKSVRLFEVGRVFLPPDGKEIRRLGLLLCGEADGRVHWRDGLRRQLDLHDLKGALESIGFGEVALRRRRATEFALADGSFFRWKRRGIAGQLFSAQATASDRRFSWRKLICLTISKRRSVARKFRELQTLPFGHPRYRADRAGAADARRNSRRDQERAGTAPGSVELFDLFSGKGAPGISARARKSLAYSLTYLDKNRTLTSDEVSAAHDRIRERLKSELGVELRE